jgi:hypothetical protein
MKSQAIDAVSSLFVANPTLDGEVYVQELVSFLRETWSIYLR